MTFVLNKLSVSQVERFDHSQSGGCELRWWFAGPMGFKEPPTGAKDDGEAGHLLLANYFKTGKGPQGRVRMGKAVTAAIAKGALPEPGSDLLVERRFDGQPQRTPEGEWIPLNPALTPIWVGDLPWDGFVDLMYRRGDVVGIIDHKFSADIDAPWTKKADDLIKTVQLPIYALRALSIWPDATSFWIAHNYVSRSGEKSDLRGKIVSLEQVREREENIASVVERMKVITHATKQADVPFNRKSCDSWGGCPHQFRCNAFKENKRMSNTDLTPEEQAMFGETPAQTTPPPAPAQAKASKLIDVPTGSILAKEAEQGAKYLISGVEHVFVCNTAIGGVSYASFTPASGGPPALLSLEAVIKAVPLPPPPPKVIPPDAPANDPKPPEKEKKVKAAKAPPMAAPVAPAPAVVTATPAPVQATISASRTEPVAAATVTTIRFELGVTPELAAFLTALASK